MKPLFSVIFLCLCGLSKAQGKLEIYPLTGNFYVYTTYKVYEGEAFPSNSMYLVTDSGVVLFDTPWDSTQFQPLLDSIEARHHKKVLMCIATHHHDDRTAGLEYYAFKGIATWSSALTLSWCKTEKNKQAQYTFSKDTQFYIGSVGFQTFYPGEGHSKDNIVIWFPEHKVLYGGCFVKSTESPGLGNLSHANVQAWPESVKKVQNAFPSARYIIPGHFGWQSRKSLKHTLKLLKAGKA